MVDIAVTPHHPSSSDTRVKILDVAGALFSERGFRAVSLRQITRQAGVNLASVNYHFGSKEALVVEVLSRVIAPINRQRLEMLDRAEARASGDPVPVEAVLEAMFAPVLSFMTSTDETDPDGIQLKLAGRCMAERAELMPETLLAVFQEVFARFKAALLKSLPDLPKASVLWRMHFTAGALLYTLTQPERVTAFSGGEIASIDPEETLAQLIIFTAAGMKAEAKRGASRNKAKLSGKMASVLAGLLAVCSFSCKATSPDSMNATLDVKTAVAYSAGMPGSGRPIADGDWISRFSDRRLDALVDEALANNKDLKVAAARMHAAEATAELAGVDRTPRLDAGFRGSRAKRNFIGFPFGGEGAGGGDDAILSSLSNDFGVSLDLSWEIDLWGRIRIEQQAAIAQYEASRADMAAIQLSIAAQTAKTWFALIEARQQQQLAQRTLDLFSKTEKSISEHFALGIDPPGTDRASQLRLARTDIASAEETLVQREQTVGQVARQLETLLSRYPAAEIDAGSKLPRLPSAPPAGIPASLLDRRPDLVAAERRLAAADRQYAAARLMVLPSINLTGSGGTTSDTLENLLNQNFSVWNIAGSAVQPILTGGAIKQGVKLRKSEIVQAAGDYEKSVLVAFREVEDSLDLEGFLARREALLLKTVALADDAYDKSRQEFIDGVGDVLTLLSAQQRKVQSEAQLITIRRLRLDNRVDLHLALGGDYRVRKQL